MSDHNNLKHELLLNQADHSVGRAAPKVLDTYRPQYHLAPQAYWMNDPNGLVYFAGYYHVFYQHHPYSPDWGPMHWGHARTKDFIHWEHLPIALAPSEDYDADGCFSGSAVAEDGVLHLFYTGHRVVDGKAVQVQCRATSTDGIQFVKDPCNPLIPTYPAEGSADFRDPKVWRHAGSWYMALGSGKDGKGNVLLYRSRELSTWQYLGVAAESNGTQGTIWECPDLFPVGEKYVLLVSPMGMESRTVLYFVGDMDFTSAKFIPQYTNVLDYGPDFYASQTFSGTRRRIMLAWMDAWETNIPSKEHNWAGALTLPRELVLDEAGRLQSQPLPELQTLRRDRIYATNLLLDDKEQLFPSTSLQKAGLEVILHVDLANTTASQFGIRFDTKDSEQVTVRFEKNGTELFLDTNKIRAGNQGVYRAELAPQTDQLTIRLFLDRSSIEIFADDGAATITSRMYPGSQEIVPTLFAIGGQLKVTSIELFSLIE